MLRSLTSVVAMLVLVLAVRPGWSQSLVEQLPDDMLWCVWVRDARQLREQLESSPLGDAWNSPELERARAAIGKEWEEIAREAADKTGLAPAEVLKEIQGAAALFSTHLQHRQEGGYSSSEWDICLVAEVPAERRGKVEEMLRGLLDKVAAEGTRSAEEFRGTRIYRVDVEKITTEKDLPEELAGLDFEHELRVNVQYAFTDTHLVLCEGPNDPAKKVLNALLSEDAPRFGALEAYRRLAPEAGTEQAGLAAWANVPRLLEAWSSAEPTGETARMFDRSGVRSLGGLLLAYEMKGNEIRTRMALETGREHSGIVEMLYSGGLLRDTAARRVPADVYNMTAWTLDLGPIWKNIRAMMRTSGSGADIFLDSWLVSTKQNFEVDIEADLIDHVAGEHVFYRRPPAPGDAPAATPAPGMPPEMAEPLSSNAVLVGLSDGQQTVDALDRLLHKLTGEPFFFPIERQDQGGFAVWKVKDDAPFPQQSRVAVGLTPLALVVASSPLEVREALRRLQGGAEKPLAEDPAYAEMVAMVPAENLRVLGYQSPESYEMVVRQLRAQFAARAYYQEDTSFTADDVPSASWWKRYFGPSISWAQLGPTVLKGESVFRMRPQQ